MGCVDEAVSPELSRPLFNGNLQLFSVEFLDRCEGLASNRILLRFAGGSEVSSLEWHGRTFPMHFINKFN